MPQTRTERFFEQFIPTSIKVLNGDGMNIDRAATTLAVSLGRDPEGKRRPGRPKQTWQRVVLKRVKTTGINSWNEAVELAKDCES